MRMAEGRSFVSTVAHGTKQRRMKDNDASHVGGVVEYGSMIWPHQWLVLTVVWLVVRHALCENWPRLRGVMIALRTDGAVSHVIFTTMQTQMNDVRTPA